MCIHTCIITCIDISLYIYGHTFVCLCGEWAREIKRKRERERESERGKKKDKEKQKRKGNSESIRLARQGRSKGLGRADASSAGCR